MEPTTHTTDSVTLFENRRDDLMSKVEEVFRVTDLNPSTRRTYLRSTKNFVNWLGERSVVPPTVLVEYKNYLQDRSDLSTRTKNLYLSGVRTLFRQLHLMGVLERDLSKTVKSFSVHNGLRKSPISDEQVRRVFQFLQKKGTKTDKRLLLLFTLLYYQGLRQKEVLDLRVEDYDPEQKTLMILGKGRDEREPINLHPQTVRVLEWFIEHSSRKSGYLFYSNKNPRGYITYQRLNQMIQGVHKECGIPNSGHGWRKVFTSKLIEEGMDLITVSSFTRHKSLSQLKTYYDRLDIRSKLPKYYESFQSEITVDK